MRPFICNGNAYIYRTTASLYWTIFSAKAPSCGTPPYNVTNIDGHLSIFTVPVLSYKRRGNEWRRWRHVERDGVSNHRRLDCLLNLLFRHKSKKTSNAPRHWPLCGESTGDRWIPLTKGQQSGKSFHLMTSTFWCLYILVALIWYQLESCLTVNDVFVKYIKSILPWMTSMK